VDALPLCGLIEAAEDMLAMINTTEGLVILNTDHIAEIGKKGSQFEIKLDIIESVVPFDEFQRRTYEYKYRYYLVSAEELADLLSKLPEAKNFPQE
jgi:hypothetical protein